MSAEWDDLARLAEAATPGPWEHDGYAGIDSEESPSWIAHLTTYDPGEGSGNPRWRADAEFIAAANPATILRLIEENRNLRTTVDADLEYQRRLEARLAAVEALLADGPDTWEGYETRDIGHAFLAESVLDFTADLRAALAAPTDTTKEN